jgi:hypothetical protein
MRWNSVFAIMFSGVMAASVLGGPIADLFKKAPKPKPEERVPELLILVKTDLDEHKRSSAAEELRQYDPVTFTDVIPILIDVARTDRSPGVRVEAVQSLAKFRPISSEIGQLLEQAEKDPSMRVKIQARTSLLHYHLAGYRSQKKDREPPIGMMERRPPIETTRAPVVPQEAEMVIPVSGTSPAIDKPLIVPPVPLPANPAPLPSSPTPQEPEAPPLELPK